MNKKICFIAPSGYGKSTAINILSKKYNVKNIKIAKPLYDLQTYFYKFINSELKGEQDGELLQFLGAKIRKENSDFLIQEFERKINSLKDDWCIITNDDCRPPDFEYLKKLGFVFVCIKGFRHDRCDHSLIDVKNKLEWQQEVKCDFVIENIGTLEEYEKNLEKLLEIIL